MVEKEKIYIFKKAGSIQYICLKSFISFLLDEKKVAGFPI